MIIIFKIAIVIGMIVIIKSLKLEQHLPSIQAWFEQLGLWSPVLFTLFYIPSAGIVVPVILLAMMAGILYGWVWGTVIVSISSTVSAVFFFILSRYYLRDYAASKVKKYPSVQRLNKTLAKGGWGMLAMLRCVPVMNSIVLNAICALSAMRLKDFIIGSWLGFLPIVFGSVYLGFMAGSLSEGMPQSPLMIVFGAVGVIATVVAVIWMKKISAQWALEEQIGGGLK